ncbi:MAG: glycoside hydrolase family 25 protein [Ruminococcus sp.]|uniref:glycoside hydrolase family 25 protein n=1 Tax=Ruminococcus sp. TaxID=41978 RepID=UPI0025FABD20|nr:glycoside hydrolase family 25 protein [Ruminococcus sp.]MCR5540985.1 glycoside hydrolase family 25 protein [Ruminococcus sp.]
MMKKGIDVSKYQGNIAWKQVKDSGIDFAIIKAGGSDDGFYTDPTYEANYKNAKAVGMPVGAYYIVGPYCVSKEDGIADAKRFLKMLEGKTFEYPVYIDLELTSPTTKTGTTDAVIAFCKTMEAAGYFCGIYASDISGFKDRLELSRLKTRALWVASYGSKPTYTKSYGMWQKSSTGRVPGIVGDVDLDECYVDYTAIIKSRGDNGFPKPAALVQEKKPMKVTVEYDDHTYSGLLEEQ